MKINNNNVEYPLKISFQHHQLDALTTNLNVTTTFAYQTTKNAIVFETVAMEPMNLTAVSILQDSTEENIDLNKQMHLKFTQFNSQDYSIFFFSHSNTTASSFNVYFNLTLKKKTLTLFALNISMSHLDQNIFCGTNF